MIRCTGTHRGIDRNPGMNGRNIRPRVSSIISPHTRESAFSVAAEFLCHGEVLEVGVVGEQEDRARRVAAAEVPR